MTHLAMEDLTVNADDIDGRGNNSYLRYDSVTGLMTVVAWDANLAFGATNVGAEGLGAAGSAAAKRQDRPGDRPGDRPAAIVPNSPMEQCLVTPEQFPEQPRRVPSPTGRCQTRRAGSSAGEWTGTTSLRRDSWPTARSQPSPSGGKQGRRLE